MLNVLSDSVVLTLNKQRELDAIIQSLLSEPFTGNKSEEDHVNF